MSITRSLLTVSSKYFLKRWKSSSRPKESKTLLQPKLLASLIGCMNPPCLTSSPTLVSSNRTQSPKFSVFGKRMFDTENSLKPERDLFRTHSFQNQPFQKTSCKSTGHCLTCNKTEPFQAEFLKTELGKRPILTLNKKQSEKQPQPSTKTSLLEKWQPSYVKFKTMFTKSVTWRKFKSKTKWNSVSKLSKSQWILSGEKLSKDNIFLKLQTETKRDLATLSSLLISWWYRH